MQYVLFVGGAHLVGERQATPAAHMLEDTPAAASQAPIESNADTGDDINGDPKIDEEERREDNSQKKRPLGHHFTLHCASRRRGAALRRSGMCGKLPRESCRAL